VQSSASFSSFSMIAYPTVCAAGILV